MYKMSVNFRSLIGSWILLLASTTSLVAAGDLRLIEAIKNNNTAAVSALLKQHADVNAAQGDGATALHWAVHLDDLKTADLLIHAGAKVNAANDIGVTPLYLACTNRNAAMVRKLLDARANPNAKLLSGETVLMNCARAGDAEAVKALVAHGADLNAKEPSHNQTALMWAAAQRHPQVVKTLVENGADIRARSRIYNQIVTSEVTQRSGREELNYTVPRGGSTPLLFAARSGDADSARFLLEAGADVNDALPDGTSALVLAAHSGHGAVGALLLDKGADPNAAAVGYTALHAAVLRADLDLVKALLAHGANPNAQITKGTPVRRLSQDFELPKTLVGATPYLLAAKFLEVDMMRVLAAAGADPRLAMKDGTTPLMAAAGVGASRNADRRGLTVYDGGKVEDESRVVEAVTSALTLGADVNEVNQTGNTALHGAASLGYDAVVKLLAEKGAPLNVKNARGQTPLAALTAGRGQAAAAAADPSSTRASTAELLRKLGAVE
jgi:ankyrin repeat protein